ncbi:hypothetical protein ACFSL4_32085 [Streptomyces caeni]|uniref:Uncharacterized protein n=1 Tax=Streptomyces caeni TaxID=2307231 RepID=A0ABW4IZ86_9ACTN
MQPTVPAEPGAEMTIRVYRVGRDGSVTQDGGTVMSLPHGCEPPLEPCALPRRHEGEHR